MKRVLAVLAVALTVFGMGLLGEAPRGFAGTLCTWKAPVDGDWYDSSKWTDGICPYFLDYALFNVAGTYTVTFVPGGTSFTSGFDVTQGNVTFQDGGYSPWYIPVENVSTITGASVTLGTSGKPVDFKIGHLCIDNGSLNIVFGSSVTLLPFGPMSCAGALTLGSGSVLVDGSSIIAWGQYDAPGSNSVGGAMVFQNSAVGNFIGPLSVTTGGSLTVKNSSSVAFSGRATLNGDLTVQSGSTFNAESLSVQGGTVTIDGANSAINLTLFSYLPAAQLGVYSGGTVNVANGASLKVSGNTDYYDVHVQSGGSIHVGDNGTFYCYGPFMRLDGGTFSRSATGAIGNWPTALDILNGGLATFSGDAEVFKSVVTITGSNSTMQTTDGGSLYCGQVNVSDGGVLSSAAGLYIGAGASRQGNVSINGGRLSAGNDLVLGADGGSGNLQLTNGATATVGGALQVASGGTPGSATVSVDGSSLQVGNNIRIGAGGVAGQSGSLSLGNSTVTQTAGSQLVVGAAANSTGTLNICLSSFTAGASTILNPTGVIVIGYIAIGYSSYSGSADLKALSFNGGRIDFYAGSLTYIGDLDIGTTPLRTPEVNRNPNPQLPQLSSNPLMLSNHELSLSGTTTIDSTAALVMEGGRLESGAMVVRGGVYFNEGAIFGNGSGGLTIGDGGPVGALVNLGPDRPVALQVDYCTTVNPNSQLLVRGGRLVTDSLTNSGNTTLSGGQISVLSTLTVNAGANLSVDGGTLTALSLVNAGTVSVDGSTSTVSAALTNQSGGLLLIGPTATLNCNGASGNAGELVLGGGAATLAGTSPLVNTGLIRGEGMIAKPVTNAAGGEIRAEDGKVMRLTGLNGANAGKINLLGGTAEFTQALTNAVGAVIIGRGALMTGGLTNQGDLAISNGLTSVFGTVQNAPGGRITVSGKADATFWNDVVNNGALLKVSAGSSATFFGAFSGAGVSGLGDVFFEADISPGFSPIAANFGGNVSLGPLANLKIELGGTSPGKEYDTVSVAGTVNLDGNLNVTLLNGFRPAHNDQFTILTFGTRTGDFAAKNGLDLGSRLSLVPQYADLSLTLTAVQGGSGAWRSNADGPASVSTNWTGGLPNGMGDVAFFGSVIGQARTVTIDAPTTLGGMIFDNAYKYRINGASQVTLSVSSGNATVEVRNGSHEIASPLVLSSPADFSVAHPSDTLTITGRISGSSGLTKSGDGILDVLGEIAYEGNTTVAGGEMRVGQFNPATAATADVDVQAGARLVADSIQVDTLTLGTGTSVTIRPTTAGASGSGVLSGDHAAAVPEPSTFVLLIAVGIGCAMSRWRKGERRSPA